MRDGMIPYGHQDISEEDIQEVVNVLRSDWLTQGPMVERFERAVAGYCGARYAVAVSSGTAALHIAALAAGFGIGDEVITSPITFAASANCIVYTGARPVFADIDNATCCIDVGEIRKKISTKTKGIIPVHFAGNPCDMAEIAEAAREYGLTVIEDAAHALGSSYEEQGVWHKVGSCAHSDMTIFSFHPVKHITTGEGGMITTNNPELYRKILMLRNHGITREPQQMHGNDGSWYYEQQYLGFNYRITDIQCSLGLSQLKRMDEFTYRRKSIAAIYNKAFAKTTICLPKQGTNSSWHLYAIRCDRTKRKYIFDALREKGIGVNVHYIPVHTHPYYQKTFGCQRGDFPIAEAYYQEAISLPIYPALSDVQLNKIISSVIETAGGEQ